MPTQSVVRRLAEALICLGAHLLSDGKIVLSGEAGAMLEDPEVPARLPGDLIAGRPRRGATGHRAQPRNARDRLAGVGLQAGVRSDDERRLKPFEEVGE